MAYVVFKRYLSGPKTSLNVITRILFFSVYIGTQVDTSREKYNIITIYSYCILFTCKININKYLLIVI